MFIVGLKPKHHLTCILVSILIPLNILMNGCNSQQRQKPKFGRWEIVRQADWKTRFYDVFFIDHQTGWAVGNSEGNSMKNSTVLLPTPRMVGSIGFLKKVEHSIHYVKYGLLIVEMGGSLVKTALSSRPTMVVITGTYKSLIL